MNAKKIKEEIYVGLLGFLVITVAVCVARGLYELIGTRGLFFLGVVPVWVALSLLICWLVGSIVKNHFGARAKSKE